MPHDHKFTHMGDHNFCRNPSGDSQSQVWCYTVDPEQKRQNCSVPFCSILKALDMSSNSNSEVDVIKSYTYVSLENLPSSFTLCTAFMVKTWNQTLEEPIFQLYDDEKKELWLRVRIFSGVTYTRYWFKIEDSKWFSAQRKVLFYPLQWTKVCLSRDSNTSSARLIVDGENLIEEYYMGKNKPGNLKLVLDYPGCTTNLNIFSTSLSAGKVFGGGTVDSFHESHMDRCA